MRRACGIAFGVATHALFFYTLYRVFFFLFADRVPSPAGSLWYDLLLAAQFGLIHSFLLHFKTRKHLSPWIPAPFYGCFFSAATSVTLLVIFAGWRSAELTVWRLTGWPRTVVEAAYIGSWLMLFYSLCVSGIGYQTGFIPWWTWVRGRQQPRRPFAPRNIYRVLRHPVYLSFMATVWFNPVMTLDRLLLAGVWTAYIFVGSWLKDERLIHYLGDTYRAYQLKVPGYPFMPFGPLARRKLPEQPDTLPLPQAGTIAGRKAAWRRLRSAASAPAHAAFSAHKACRHSLLGNAQHVLNRLRRGGVRRLQSDRTSSWPAVGGNIRRSLSMSLPTLARTNCMPSKRWPTFVAWDGVMPLLVLSSLDVLRHALGPGDLADLLGTFIVPTFAALIRCAIGMRQFRSLGVTDPSWRRQSLLAASIIVLMLFEVVSNFLRCCQDVPLKEATLIAAALYASYLSLIWLTFRSPPTYGTAVS